MPDPKRLISVIQKAITACQNTPGRAGHVVTLPVGCEVLVSGDLHGNLHNFKQLVQIADLAKNPNRHLVFQELLHGRARYPDGSDKSHQAVDVWCALKCQFPDRVHYLLGNHELAQWTNKRVEKNYEELNTLFMQGVATAYGEEADNVYEHYLSLFAVLPLAVRTANGVYLSHSLPAELKLDGWEPKDLEQEEFTAADLNAGGAVHSLVWGRDTDDPHVAAFLRKVSAELLISGHIPCDEGFDIPNERQIILDSLGSPAAYILFPTDRPLSHAELRDLVRIL